MYSLLSSTVAPDLASTSSPPKGDFIALHPAPATSETERKSIKGTPLFWILLSFFLINSGIAFSQTSCTPTGICNVPFLPTQIYPPSFTIITPTTLTGDHIQVNGDLIINASVTFTNCLIKVNPGSRIIVNPGRTLTLDGSCLNTMSLTDVWGGILLNGSLANLFMSNTTIQNAETGIYTKPCAYFELNGGNVMLNNLDHIVIEPCNNTNSNIVYGTCFTSTSLLTNSAGYTKTRYGIHFASTTPLSIMPVNTFMNVGEPLQNKNIFEFCENGIYAHGWNLTIKNNLFRWINPFGPITNGKYSCIWYRSIGTPRPNPKWQVVIGGPTGTSQVNAFEDSYRGIQANSDAMDLSVIGNSFTRNTMDGLLVKNSYESDFKIHSNLFIDVALSNTFTFARAAIYFSDALTTINPAIEIFENTITTSAPSTYFNYTENCGIKVEDPYIVGSPTYYYIWKNKISGKRAGIYVNRTIDAVVECNEIDLATVPYDPDTLSPVNVISVGIYNNISPFALIIRNVIKGTGTVGNFLPQSTGILNVVSEFTKIYCNKTEKMSQHIENRADSWPSEVQLNDLTDGERGIVVRGNTSNIGDQGNLTWPADNRWWGTWGSCVALGQEGWLHKRNNNIPHRYHYRIASPPADPSGCNTYWGSTGPFALFSLTAPKIVCSSCPLKPYNYARYLYDEETGIDTYYVSEEGLELVNGEIDYPFDSYSSEWWDSWNLVNGLLNDTTGLTLQTEYIAFLSQPEQVSKQKLFSALQSLHPSTLDLSVAYLDEVTETHAFSEAMTEYISIMLQVLSNEFDTLNDAQYESLIALATACPEEKGPAVVFAQSSIEKYKGEYPVSICLETLNQSKVKQLFTGSNATIKGFYSNAQFSILGLPENEMISISIFTSTGSLIFEKKQTESHNFDLQLPSGIYSYRILKTTDNRIVSGKFSVIN